jgi:hypothetical protein
VQKLSQGNGYSSRYNSMTSNPDHNAIIEEAMGFDIREVIGLVLENAGSRQHRMDTIWVRATREDRF